MHFQQDSHGAVVLPMYISWEVRSCKIEAKIRES